MVTTAALAQALTRVRHENDEHWTADGEVKLSFLEAIVGETVTRDDVRKIMPIVRNRPADVVPVKPAEVLAAIAAVDEHDELVSAATGRQTDARAATRAARDAVLVAKKKSADALRNFQAQFPIVTPEAAIKAHIARSDRNPPSATQWLVAWSGAAPVHEPDRRAPRRHEGRVG
jgi:hypothetical protein